jgi:protein TonB
MTLVSLDVDATQTYEIPSLNVNILAIASPPVQQQTKQTEKKSPLVNTKEVNKKVKTPKLVKKENASDKILISETQHEKKDLNKKQDIEKNLEDVIGFYQQPDKIKTEENSIASPKVASLSQALGEQNSTIIHKANYRSQTPPLYPQRSYELGQQGTVILLAQINHNGKPKSLKIEESSGYQLLDSAALAAVKQWEFEPIRIKERAIVSWVRVPVRFVIQ